MAEKTVICATEADTLRLAEKLTKLLQAPAFLARTGDLGAGKPAFVRGMGAALGTDDVSSPTFTIVSEHNTVPRLLHFDAYRLSDADELYAIGFSDYLAEPAILVMEWAELVSAALPRERLDVRIEGSGGDPRRITFTPRGAQYERAVQEL